jgi:hypothetical protein
MTDDVQVFVSSGHCKFPKKCVQSNQLLTSSWGSFLTTAHQTHNILSETSVTLELLFQFVYPQRLPALVGESFSTIAALADAAEKYEVFSAMVVCEFRMRREAQPIHQQRSTDEILLPEKLFC